MNLMRWLFSVRHRHSAGIRRYERGGAGVRTVTLILMLVLCGAALGLEAFGLSMFGENLLAGILLLIAAAGFVIAASEFCLVYAVTAARMLMRAAAERAARRAEERQAADGEEPREDGEAPRTYRAFDLILLLLGLLLAVGVLVAAVVIGVKWFS